MKNNMTPRERVFATINHRTPDCMPCISPTSVVNVEMMQRANILLKDAHTDGHMMAKLSSLCHDILGFDSIAPYFSIHLEASALGAEVTWGNDNTNTYIKTPLLQSIDNYSYPQNIWKSREINQLLEAIKILKEKYNDTVAVIGKVIGPLSLAYELYGVDNLLLDIIINPNLVKNFLNVLFEIPIHFAKLQFKAGADIVTWAEHATSDLISAELYREIILPFHKIATRELNSYGPLILHTCGNVMDRLKYISESGFPIFHIDSHNNIPAALDIINNRLILTGGINNPSLLVYGDSKTIKSEVIRCIDDGIKLISPECAIPSRVSSESLITVTKTSHAYRITS